MTTNNSGPVRCMPGHMCPGAPCCMQPRSPTGQLGCKLDRKVTSALKSCVFTMLGYPPLDTVTLSEITSPYNKSEPVIINITNATTAESLTRTLPGPPP